MPCSRGSSQPRDGTQVSHIAGRFFTISASREAQEHWKEQSIPYPGQLPNPAIKLGSLALQVDTFYPSEPAGKPKNTRKGNVPLLQGYFPTQESNWGLLHCRWILYQLRYLGSYSDILSLKTNIFSVFKEPAFELRTPKLLVIHQGNTSC